MTCTETPRYNHFTCKGGTCTKPLTLGDKELIRKSGISLLCHDDETGIPYCGDCLADLPHGPEALGHVCGEEMPVAAVAPEAAVLPVVFAEEPPVRRPAAKRVARFVAAEVSAWVADIDARLAFAAETGCDAKWCTAYRWDGAHVPTCNVVREDPRCQ